MIDAALLEIFRGELESHADAITGELLTLEKGAPSGRSIEAMMRAAHSIKGAARVVRFEPIARLAHLMEDYFVAAQRGARAGRGAVSFPTAVVDSLLRAVDLLQATARQAGNPPANWAEVLDGTFAPVIADLGRHLAAPQDGAVEDHSQQAGDLPCIRVDGALGGERPESLRQQLVEHQRRGATHVQLDVASVTDVDALGLLLLQRVAAARAAPAPLFVRLKHPSADFRLLLKAAGLESLLADPPRVPSKP